MNRPIDTDRVYRWDEVPDKGLFEIRAPGSNLPEFKEYIRGVHGRSTHAAALWAYGLGIARKHPYIGKIPEDLPMHAQFRQLDPKEFVFSLEYKVRQTDVGERIIEAIWPGYVDTLEDHLQELADSFASLGIVENPPIRWTTGVEAPRRNLPFHVRGMLVRQQIREIMFVREVIFDRPVSLLVTVLREGARGLERGLNKVEARLLLRDLPVGWTPKGEGFDKRVEFAYENEKS